MLVRTFATAVAICLAMGAYAATAEKAEKKTAAPASGKTAGSSATNDPGAVELLQRIEQQHGAVRAVVGNFSQTKVDASFGSDSIDSSARFSMLKPNNFKVEYLPPKESINLISGQTSYRYVPANKQVEKYTFKKQSTVRDLNYLLLGFGAPTQELLSVYNVQRGNNANSVKLIPKNQKEAQFKYILMEVTDQLLPKRFTMEQTEGTKTIVNIDTGSLQVGAALSARDFQPNWPKGVNEVDMQ